METTQILIPIHDITDKIDDILRQLHSVQATSVDSGSVQATIDRLEAIKKDVAVCCCTSQNCPVEVIEEPTLAIAV